MRDNSRRTWVADPRDYPGALTHMLKAGLLVFPPPKHPVDLRDWSQWLKFKFGAWKKTIQILDDWCFLRSWAVAKPLCLKRGFVEMDWMRRPFSEVFSKRWRNGIAQECSR
jgi:hypothetical protein